MTLPASNLNGDGFPQTQLSFGQIETEFGQTSSRRIGQYRTTRVYGAWSTANAGISPTISSNGLSFPLSTNAGRTANQDIPTSGEIKFSDFFSGKRTVLIDAYSVTENASMLTFAASGTRYQNYTMNAKTAWNNGNRVRVGGENISEQPSSDPANTKVILYVNKWLPGTPSGDLPQEVKSYVALKTGSWPASTDLHVIVGDQGRITGGGGRGGNAGDGEENGTAGKGGTSAFGANNAVTVTVKNGGVIRRGYGGGGGGGGYYSSSKWSTTTQQGGGGGGGGGYSIQGLSSGGSGHNAGGAGAVNGGGAGGTRDGSAGDGGDGGDSAAPIAENGDDGNQSGGDKGSAGNGFRETSNGLITLIVESGAKVPNQATPVGVSRQLS